MRNYRLQDPPRCATCTHVFIKSEWEEGPEHFCTLGAPPRPRCGSVFMDEAIIDLPEPDQSAAYRAWDAWEEPRRVRDFGLCDDYRAAPAPKDLT